MSDIKIYKDIAERTNGSVMIGVVGPVRTGKSTFIKRFMEQMVIPNIEDVYVRERAKDELPQSGSGRTIMTSEPKFVPEEAVQIAFDNETHFSVRLVDCVGYMVNGAAGIMEDGSERMVTTPWFDHEISMTEAAESGTYKVITEHSTIGLVVTTDGSICDIPREDYVEAEERVVAELKSIGKPFALLINCADPDSENALKLKSELSKKYDVSCMCVNCLTLNKATINGILETLLGEFPISEVAIWLPDWVSVLSDNNDVSGEIYSIISKTAENMNKVNDINALMNELNASSFVDLAELSDTDMGSGTVNVKIEVPRELYYELVSKESGLDIKTDGELMKLLCDISRIKSDYEYIESALNDVREKGYGVVMPTASELKLGEPQIVKQNGKYAVKLKARSSAIHMLKTAVETEISPTIGGENASDEIVGFLLQGYDGDMSKLWESNIFGRPLYELAQDGIKERIDNLPENARVKLQETLQRIVNEGRGTLICILI